MNKKALLGKLFLLAIVVIAVLLAAVYFAFIKGDLNFSTGKITFNIEYDDSGDEGEIPLIEEIEDDEEIEEVDETEDKDEEPISIPSENILLENNLTSNETNQTG